MAKRNPRIPAKLIRENIEKRLARYDRDPFRDVLSDALSAKPTIAAWKRWAKKDPGKYANSIASLAKAAGFAERSESVKIEYNAETVARELEARFGKEKGRQLLKATGLPESLISDDVIEHDSL